MLKFRAFAGEVQRDTIRVVAKDPQVAMGSEHGHLGEAPFGSSRHASPGNSQAPAWGARRRTPRTEPSAPAKNTIGACSSAKKGSGHNRAGFPQRPTYMRVASAHQVPPTQKKGRERGSEGRHKAPAPQPADYPRPIGASPMNWATSALAELSPRRGKPHRQGTDPAHMVASPRARDGASKLSHKARVRLAVFFDSVCPLCPTGPPGNKSLRPQRISGLDAPALLRIT